MDCFFRSVIALFCLAMELAMEHVQSQFCLAMEHVESLFCCLAHIVMEQPKEIRAEVFLKQLGSRVSSRMSDDVQERNRSNKRLKLSSNRWMAPLSHVQKVLKEAAVNSPKFMDCRRKGKKRLTTYLLDYQNLMTDNKEN